ncbi:MAG: DNA-deoxyinosine glycosylase [Armatimonadetes bacterium]|nr:DNA-deoxyinosine glycosylase [Armatimonadota bacterium]
MRLKGLCPIVDENSELLILGTFPSCQSLLYQEYYANPKNKFWEIMGKVYEFDHTLPYDRRIEFLKAKKMALWDVIESCCRSGSSDSNITCPSTNDFESFYRDHPSIKYILFNGKNARNDYEKLVGSNEQRIKGYLPSSSPANTHCTTDKKVSLWKKIIDNIAVAD